jgi:hypothetical protein
MYTANGVTREFPAPADFSGFVVLSPPGGRGFLMKQEQAYTVISSEPAISGDKQ